MQMKGISLFAVKMNTCQKGKTAQARKISLPAPALMRL